MDILVGPISGSHIVNQLAAIDLLSQYNYKPKISMGASGGIVAILAYLSGNFTTVGLERVVRDLSSKNFVENWVTAIPSWIIGFFQGSLFRHPSDNMEYIRNNLSPGILMDNEIWIQTYDIESEKTNLYCSLREGESKLYVDPTRFVEMGLNKPRFISGCVNTCCKAAKATSAIPTVLPPVVIDGENHVDGGIAYSSPIIPLSKSIKELGEVHIIYIIGSNIYAEDESVSRQNPSIIDTGSVIVKYLLKSHITQDRITGYNIVSSTCDDIEETDITIDDYFRRRVEWKSSFLEIYPLTPIVIDLFNFDGEDLVKLYKSQIPNLKLKVRYVPKNLVPKCNL